MAREENSYPVDVGAAAADPPTGEPDAPRPPTEPGPPKAMSPLERRQRVLLWITSATAVLALAGLGFSTVVKSPSQLAADQGPPRPSLMTAVVQDRVLTQTVVERRTVVAGGQVTVTPSAVQGASTLVVTSEPVLPGRAVRPGEVLIQVSGRPVFALPGATPAYRDLKPGDDGGDVRELQAALRALGIEDSDPSGYFGAGTKAAVARLYTSHGYDPATTGGFDDESDQQALQAAAQAVIQATRTRTADQNAYNASEHADPRSAAAVGAALQTLTYAEQDLDTAEQAQARLIATTGYDLPMGEFAFIPSFPAQIGAISCGVGTTVSAPLVTVDTGELQVTAMVDQGDASLLKQGMDVQLDSEVLGTSPSGTITYLGPYSPGGESDGATANGIGGDGTATGTTGSGDTGALGGSSGAGPVSQPGSTLVVKPSPPLTDAWLGQNIRLTITAAKTPTKVLAVPAAAVSQSVNGQVMVTVEQPSGTQVQVPVTAGVDADGYIAVTPVVSGALVAGDAVVTGI